MVESLLKDLPYVLRRDDSDANLPEDAGRIYGARFHRGPHGSNWIARLQASLAKLKFALVAAWENANHENTTQTFDDKTEWAVREFQMAAKLLSAEHATTGASVTLTGDAKLPIDEPVSGVVNARTLQALKAWAQQEIICPVQISVLNTTTGEPVPTRNYLWRDFGISQNVQVSARDRSGHYSPINGQPTTPRDLTQFQPLGELLRYQGVFGPVTNQEQAWKNENDFSEALPARFFELPAGNSQEERELRARLLSTFRVVRSVSDAEGVGFFEGGNGYDDQVVSFGLFQWTLPPSSEGELTAFLAYLKHRDPVGFERAFGRFGLDSNKQWKLIAGSADGRLLHLSDIRKFASAPTQPGEDGKGIVPPKSLEGRRNYRYWHWYYRFAMAGRTVDGYRRAMWDITRIRLRDVLSVSWPVATEDEPYPFVGEVFPGRPATLGETFRSERTVAMLLRWHVKRPAHVAKMQPSLKDKVLELRETYKYLLDLANSPFEDNHRVSDWSSVHEIALADALLTKFEEYVDDDTMRIEIVPWEDPKRAAAREHRLPQEMPDLADRFTILSQGATAPAFNVLQNAPPPNQPWQDLAADSPLRTAFTNASITLSSHAQYKRITPANQVTRAIWHVQDRDQHGARIRLFNLERQAAPVRAEITEYPTLSLARVPLARGSFFEYSGLPITLPAPSSTSPLITIQGDEGAALLADLSNSAGGMTPQVLNALRDRLRARLPDTDIRFAAVTIPELRERREGTDVLWTVPTIGNSNLTFFSIRRVDANQAAVDPPGVSLRYGGLTLKLGVTSDHVVQLRKDLRELGFLLVPEPTGAPAEREFDRTVMAGVLAFQSYASRERVGKLVLPTNPANPLVKRLISVNVPEAERYSGPVSGVVDRETTAVIEHWLSMPRHWRCPVVVDARTNPAEGPPSAATVETDGSGNFLENLWGPNDDTETAHLFFVTDFSEPAPTICRQLGRYINGPKIINNGAFTPARAELTAEFLTGEQSPAGETLSTYKVIRAVSNGTACGGFLDGVDATSANRLITFGWFNLKDGIKDSKLFGGLGSLFSVAHHLEPRPYCAAIGRDGIEEGRPWSDGKKLKDLIQGSGNATLVSEIARQDENGAFKGFLRNEDGNEWRGWHSVYRLAQAGRRREIARAVWDLTRVQLWRFRSIPLRTPFVAKLEQLLTSEQAWAVFYLWHTQFPADVVTRPSAKKDAEAADPVEAAVTSAGLTAPPASDAQEGALVDALVAKAKELHPQNANASFWQALDAIVGNGSALSRVRNSFTLDLNHRPFIPTVVSKGILPAVIRVGPRPTPAGDGQSIPMVGIGCEQDPLTNLLRITHALIGLPDPDGGAGTVRCLRVPLQAATENVDLALLEDPGTTVLASDAHGSEPEDLTTFRLDPTADLSILEALDLRFDPSALFGVGGRIGTGRIALADLAFDANDELIGGIRAVIQANTPFGALPLVFAGSGDDGANHGGSYPAADFSLLTWDSVQRVLSAQTTTLGAKLRSLTRWPIDLSPNLPFNLTASSGEESFSGRLDAALDAAGLDLVPTLVRLELKQIRLLIDSAEGLSLALAEGVDHAKGELGADLFADATEKAGTEVFEKYVNHVYEQLESTGTALGKLFSLSPPQDAGVLLGAGARVLGWDEQGRPELVTEFLRGLTKIGVNGSRRLRTFAGEVFGERTPCHVKFASLGNQFPARFEDGLKDGVLREDGPEAGMLRVVVPLQVKVNDEARHESENDDIFRLAGEFGFLVASSEAGVRFGPGAFSAKPEVFLTVNEERFEKGRNFGGFLSLHVPRGTTFAFSTDPTKAAIRWDRLKTLERTAKKIFVRVPASDWDEENHGAFDPNKPEPKRFTFELESFGLSSSGFDLKGAVRVENVSFNNDHPNPPQNGDLDDDLDQQTTTGFKAPLAIQRPEVSAPKDSEQPDGGSEAGGKDEPVGVLEFSNSRLVRGSLKAGFQLRLFDDAKGIITFVLSEDPETKNLTVVGTVEINTAIEYRLEELLCTFKVTSLKLRTSFTRNGKRVVWNTEGTMSGSAEFLPSPGESVSGPLAAISDFFSGVRCEFEDLNPVKLGRGAAVSFHFPPKTFTLANVMEVDLNGITVGDNRATANENNFGLLGDVRLKSLPGINGTLTFGGINLQAKGRALPAIRINRIGAALAIPGGGEFEAFFDRIENERESGFSGGMALRSKVLPPVSGMITLTDARCVDPATKALTDDRISSLALNTTVGIEAPLGYGFYLRAFGLGLGIFRSLRNLGGASRELPITRRILKFVDDPNGLPDPADDRGWEPDTPARPGKTPPNWMIVGKALITFGKLAPDKPHLFAGTLLAAIDHTGKVTLGVNDWLFTSPNETKQAEFLARPVSRGAIQYDPDAGKVFGVFRTLPNPKLGSQAPPLIGQVLAVYQTQLMFLADRNGFLVEAGWPWETRVTLPLPSPLRGSLTSGYRFGIYRGVVVTQLNFAIDLQLDAGAGIDFKTPLGSAGAKLTVRGSGYFRCSLVGALDEEFRPSVLGDVRVAATVEVGVQAHAELSRKITKWCKIRLRIRINASFNLSITAALAAALEADGVPAFTGDADVSVSVSGYRIAGQVPFQCRSEKVESTRRRLEEILPTPISELGKRRFFSQSLEDGPAAKVEGEKGWHYRSRRVPETNRIVVALLPEPGRQYPALRKDPDDGSFDPDGITRFKLKLKDAGRSSFRTFVGAPGATTTMSGNQLAWSEDLLGELIPAQDMLREFERPSDTKDEPLDGATPRPLNVSLFLYGLGQADLPPSGFDCVVSEHIDERTLRPRDDDQDDHTARVAPRTDQASGSSPNFKRDTKYDQAVSESSNRTGPRADGTSEPSANPDGDVDGLSTGLIAAEVIDLYGADDVARGGDPPEGMFLAHRLRVVLLFETSDQDILNADDPAAHLIDIRPDDPNWKPLVVDEDKEVTLTHYAAATVNREYDFIQGKSFQSPEQVCLCWDFRFEDHNPEKPLEAYGPGFEGFRVTRTNVSNPSCLQKVSVLNAAWLDPARSRGLKLGTSDELVRVPFQFVDDLGDPADKSNEVREGDELVYEVEALVAKKEKRFAFKQTVVRELIKPLGPPVAAIALHRPCWGTDGTRFQDAGTIELALMIPAKQEDKAVTAAVEEDEFNPDEFQVRYRFVTSEAVGHYGLNPSPIASTRPERSLPEQATKGLGLPNIRFNGSPQARPMPWEDDALHKLPLATTDWKEIKVIPPATDEDPMPEPVLLGYRAIAKLSELKNYFGEVPRGKAIELWIGRDRSPISGPSRVERSVLVPCRHAVEMPEPPEKLRTPMADPTIVRRDYFSTGSTVSAIEPLPSVELNREDQSWFIPLSAVEHVVRPGTDVLPGTDGRTASVPNDVRVCLTWRMPEENLDAPYDPTIGFRLYRADRFNPALHRVQGHGILPRLETEFQVVPDSHYRSTPSTISLRAIQQEVVASAGYTGDWRAVGRSGPLPLWDYSAPASRENPFDFVDRDDRPEDVEDPLGAILLFRDLRRVAYAIKQGLKAVGVTARPRWNIAEPFEDRADLRIREHRANLARFTLRFLRSIEKESALPAEGRSLALVANIKEVLYIRIFDANGRVIVDTHEKMLIQREQQVEALKAQLKSLSLVSEPSKQDTEKILSLLDALFTYTVQRARHLAEEFNLLRNDHEPKNDPYAWGVAEALGLSAEVVFIDPSRNVPVDLDGILRHPTKSGAFALALKEALDTGGTPKTAPAVAITLFLAEDGETVLDALRLTYLGPWPTFEVPRGFDLTSALLLKLLGRDPDPTVPWPQRFEFPADFPPGERQQIIDRINSWFGETVRNRLLGGFALGEAIPEEQEAACHFTLFRRDGVLASTSPTSGGTLPRTVPVDRNGLVRFDLPVPDRIAHAYDIAVEPIRRYDLIRLRLYRAKEQADRAADTRTEEVRFAPETVPFSSIVPVHVGRTRALVPHNVVATPLPGSIQGYVFAHPAEFAACASAANAAATEYSGQSVFLERRIFKEQERLEILTDREVFDVNWALYQSYLLNGAYEERTPGPPIELGPEREDTPLSFRPIEGTRVGIFAADRYVFHDIPADYEYRLSAFSTAGAAQSPTAYSPFISPLYDLVRQRPTTEGRFEAFLDGDKLVLKVTMVHPRLHLRPDLRGLWVDSDEIIPCPQAGKKTVGIFLGSLPDLIVDYRVYLNANYRPGDPRAVPVLNLLVELVSPLDPKRRTGNSTPKLYLARSPDEKRVLVLPSDQTGEGAPEEQVVIEQAANGAIVLVVPLRFTPEAREFISPIKEAAAQQSPEFDKVFFFAVRRGGVESQIVPLTTATRTLIDGEGD